MFGNNSKKRFLVCGLGTVGISVADTLDKLNCYVVGLDIKEEVVASIRSNPNYKFLCFCTDVLNPRFMEDMGELGSFDVAILTMDDLLGKIVCTKILRQHGVKHIIARAANELERGILQDLKVERFEHVKENLGKHMAHISYCSYVLDYDYIDLQQVEDRDTEQLAAAPKYAMVNIRVPQKFAGDTIATLKNKLSMDKDIQVIAVHFGITPAQGTNPSFRKDESFEQQQLSVKDTLLICGPEKQIENLIQELAKLDA